MTDMASTPPSGGLQRLSGKVALVTGCNGGIGTAIAQRFGEAGAKLVLGDLDPDASGPLLRSLDAAGIEAHAVRLDIASEESWATVMAQAQDRFGRLDIAVNNAGVGSSAPRGIEDVSLAEWRRVMSVNLDGTFLGVKAQVESMKRTGGGSIVIIGSIAGFVGSRGGPAYGTSKGALRTLTRHTAYSCARQNYNIRVNCIHPSYIWSPLAARLVGKDGSTEAARARLAAVHPFGVLGAADDVAWAALYLASDEARLANGIDLVLDGGALATAFRDMDA